LDINGMTPRQIGKHYENNYGGAVLRLNIIADELAALDPQTTPAHTINRLKQEEMAALNSTLLHELYFASLGGDGRAVPEAMASAITRDFGSVDRWRHEFIALANALTVSSGWALLTWVRAMVGSSIKVCPMRVGRRRGIPVLALDMYEHAYQIDFGTMLPPTWPLHAQYRMERGSGRYEDAILVKPARPLCKKSLETCLPSRSTK